MTTTDPFGKSITVVDDPKDHLYLHGLTTREVINAVSNPIKIYGSSRSKICAVYFAKRQWPTKKRMFNVAIVKYNRKGGGRVITAYPTDKIGGGGIVPDDIRYQS